MLARYTLFQLPGWLAVGVAAWFGPAWVGLPGWVGALAFVAWVLKDLLLFPFVRIGYEDHDPGDARGLVGALAIATEPIVREGFVRAGSELWRAELGSPGVPAGSRVRVRAVEGMRLIVEAETEESAR